MFLDFFFLFLTVTSCFIIFIIYHFFPPSAASMRKLKFHEKKLLKRVNFIEYKREWGHREALVTRRYHLTERDDYKKY